MACYVAFIGVKLQEFTAACACVLDLYLASHATEHSLKGLVGGYLVFCPEFENNMLLTRRNRR